jgi:hypothetical protein
MVSSHYCILNNNIHLGVFLIVVTPDWDFSYEFIMSLIKEKCPHILIQNPSASSPLPSPPYIATTKNKQPTKQHQIPTRAFENLYGVRRKMVQQWLGRSIVTWEIANMFLFVQNVEFIM